MAVRRRFTSTVANWHRELQACNGGQRHLAVLAKRTDNMGSLDCQTRFSTHCMMGAHFQVAAHLPSRALELLTHDQRQVLKAPVLGEPLRQRAEANDSAALKCIEVLIRAGVLDAAYRPVLPADIVVRLYLLLFMLQNGAECWSGMQRSTGTRTGNPEGTYRLDMPYSCLVALTTAH